MVWRLKDIFHKLKLTNLRGTDYFRSVWTCFGKIQVCMFIRWHLRSCGLHRVHIITMVHWLNHWLNSHESVEVRCHIETRMGVSDEVLRNEIYYCVGYQIEMRWTNKIKAKMDFTWTLFSFHIFFKEWRNFIKQETKCRNEHEHNATLNNNCEK